MATEKEEELRKTAMFLTQLLEEIYGCEVAFILLAAPMFEEKGIADYISNGRREDCIKWMQETIERFQKNELIPRTEGNA